MPIDRPASPESKEFLRKKLIIQHAGVNEGNLDAFAEHELGTYAVAKDDGKRYFERARRDDPRRTTGKLNLNEDRAVVREITSEDGYIVGFDLFAIDGVGGGTGGDKAAQIAAEELSNDPDYNTLGERISRRYLSEHLTPSDGACWAGVKIRNDECEVSRMGDCRVIIWDEKGNKVFSTSDQETEITKPDGRKVKAVARSLGIGSKYDKKQDTAPDKIILKPGWTVEICSDGRTKNRSNDDELERIKYLDTKNAAMESYKQTENKMYSGNGSPDNQTVIIYSHKGYKDVPTKVASCSRANFIQDLARMANDAGEPFMTLEEGIYAGFYKRKNKKLGWDDPSNIKIVEGYERVFPTRISNFAVKEVLIKEVEDDPFKDDESPVRKTSSNLRSGLLLAGGLTLAGIAGIGIHKYSPDKSTEPEVTVQTMDRTIVDIVNAVHQNDKVKLKVLIEEADRQIREADTQEERYTIPSLTAVKKAAEKKLSK